MTQEFNQNLKFRLAIKRLMTSKDESARDEVIIFKLWYYFNYRPQQKNLEVF